MSEERQKLCYSLKQIFEMIERDGKDKVVSELIAVGDTKSKKEAVQRIKTAYILEFVSVGLKNSFDAEVQKRSS